MSHLMLLLKFDGDESWPGKKPILGSKTPAAASESRVEALRRENGGLLPVQYIQDIPACPRNRYPVSTTEIRTPLPLFTSIMHRVLQPDEELSESDDGVDETWLGDKHEQEIMIIHTNHLNRASYRSAGWTMRGQRGIPHPFYCSDMFCRQVKKDHEWIGSTKERSKYYHRFSARLWQEKKIS